MSNRRPNPRDRKELTLQFDFARTNGKSEHRRIWKKRSKPEKFWLDSTIDLTWEILSLDVLRSVVSFEG